PASVIPIALGSLYAAGDGYFSCVLFIWTLIGGCLLQCGTNLINSYGDFVRGLDTKESLLRSPELVIGKLQPRQVYLAGLACFALAALIGLYLMAHCGWGLLIFGLIGIVFGYGYTAGMSYKYHGLGLIMVFILMGIMMVLGSYFVQTGFVDWSLIWISLPNACLITGILSGNELRDFDTDKKFGIKTTGVILGYRGALLMYQGLHLLAYLLTGLFLAIGLFPPFVLLVYLTLPGLLKIIRHSNRAVNGDRAANISLVPISVSLQWQFGLLLLLGCLAGIFWQ
ncbi:MAG: UbiA family prenyltransferase, partial [Clostridiales bacterium]